jgi:hypothetical protein
VTYVHPPHVIVLNRPVPATNFGRIEFGRAVKIYQRKTSEPWTYRMSVAVSRTATSMQEIIVPDVMAMKIWKTERSGTGPL